MDKTKVYISLFSMVAGKNVYVRLFFKVLLLAVYFAFFSVQLFLRYTSSHSLQSLNLDSYKETAVAKKVTNAESVSSKDTKKNNSISYLNKRFHPQDEVTIPSQELHIERFYKEVRISFLIPDDYIKNTPIYTFSLRGPPALC
jgi:hypothetical protein